MSYFARRRWVLEVSSASDYSKPAESSNVYATTPTLYRCPDVITAVTSAGTSYNTNTCATLEQVEVTNLDSTNYVTVQYSSLGSGSVAQYQRVQPGQTLMLTDVVASVGLIFVAHTASCQVLVSFTGA